MNVNISDPHKPFYNEDGRGDPNVPSRIFTAEEVPAEQHYLFYTMFCLCLAGLLGMAITGDAFNFFVFLEIASLSSYVLIALGRDRRALMASFQYLLLGTVGATLIVIGVGILYLMTGTLNMADLGQRLPQLGGSRPVLAALAFLTVGLFLKAALFPLHAWLPNAYAFAPSFATAFLAASLFVNLLLASTVVAVVPEFSEAARPALFAVVPADQQAGRDAEQKPDQHHVVQYLGQDAPIGELVYDLEGHPADADERDGEPDDPPFLQLVEESHTVRSPA